MTAPPSPSAVALGGVSSPPTDVLCPREATA
jgi:hypothetical protein